MRFIAHLTPYASRLTVQYRWVILGCCILAYATSHLTRWSYTGLSSYISADLQLDKAGLGLLGAAFFYPYALAQVPWGRLTDQIGGRLVISFGMIAAAVLLGLFATAHSLNEAIGWRLGIGIAAACGFVPIAGLLARWFEPQERGMANGAYYGLGGGLGEAAAFLLLPLLGIYFLNRPDLAASGWRAAMVATAAGIGAIGLLCLVVLRSSPGDAAVRSGPLSSTSERERRLWLTDPVLWLLGLYFAAGIVALRLIPGWLPMYATDLYRLRWGYDQQAAVVAGGTLSVIYVIGHVAGSPVIGRLSDSLLKRGISRVTVAASGLAVSMGAFGLLAVPMPSPFLFGVLALMIGVSLHTFPVINAAAAERWGIRRAGESLGWINMVGQLAGAVSLSVSGYVGMAVAGSGTGSQSPDPLTEYVGIWYLGAASCAVGALAGWMAHRAMK